jgi:thiol-disulfide isomerase/thioredoxin
MKIKSLLTALILFLFFYTSYAQTALKAGIWRGALTTESGNEIPFNFQITGTGSNKQIAIINGAERFKVTDVSGKGDSVFIHMPLFDSEFRLRLIQGTLVGKWIRHSGNNDSFLDFKAVPNTAWRFKTPAKPASNIAGRWAATFGEGDSKDLTVGEFKQTGSKLTGTFLTTTGDYRYLEGVVTGNDLYLSCFDGGHAYLFTGKINGKNITDGNFYSGLKGHNQWVAVKDAKAKLPDAYSLTALKQGYKRLAFTFKDLNGKDVSLTDARFKNKVVIVQILGSWCPNCMDETAYLINYYKKYHAKGVEIVGLAYERTTDFARSQKSVMQLKNRFNIPYPLLLTGYTPSNGDPARSLPMMAKVVGFPTTIIIDKKGDVRKIHTGFSGPGTGKYYTDFIKEFEGLTDGLLAGR